MDDRLRGLQVMRLRGRVRERARRKVCDKWSFSYAPRGHGLGPVVSPATQPTRVGLCCPITAGFMVAVTSSGVGQDQCSACLLVGPRAVRPRGYLLCPHRPPTLRSSRWASNAGRPMEPSHPTGGESRHLPQPFLRSIGGDELNVAVAMSLLGVKARGFPWCQTAHGRRAATLCTPAWNSLVTRG